MLATLYAPPFDIMFPGTFEAFRHHAKEANKWTYRERKNFPHMSLIVMSGAMSPSENF